MEVQVCTHICRCYRVSAQFEACRESIVEQKGLVRDVCRVLYYKVGWYIDLERGGTEISILKQGREEWMGERQGGINGEGKREKWETGERYWASCSFHSSICLFALAEPVSPELCGCPDCVSICSGRVSSESPVACWCAIPPASLCLQLWLHPGWGWSRDQWWDQPTGSCQQPGTPHHC